MKAFDVKLEQVTLGGFGSAAMQPGRGFSARRNSNSPVTPRLSKASLSSSMRNLSPEVSWRSVKSSRELAGRSAHVCAS